VEVVNGILAGYAPYEGQQWLSFNSGNTPAGSSISQTFLTTTGQSYGVSFALGSMGSGNVSMKVTVVGPSGTILASNTFTPPNDAWGLQQLSFTASSSNATILFTDTSTQTAGVDLVLDDVIVGPPASNAPPVVTAFANGGFEAPQIATNTTKDLLAGSMFLTGWTVGGTGGPVEVVNGILAGYAPYEGQQWLSFNSGNTAAGSSISQTFLTTAGQSYGISFALGSMGSGNVSMKVTVVGPSGTILASNTFTPPHDAWGLDQLSFTASSSNTTLLFTDTSVQTGAVDLVLDDVVVGIAPVITLSPSNQTVTAGSSATFTGAANGSAPLGYQWQFNGTNIAGATNTSLTVTNAQAANVGSYRIVASNPSGSATSSAATLTINESTIQAVSTTAVGGQSVVVSIDLAALGSESAVGFTLDFDPSVLTYMSVVAGSGASGAFFLANSNQIASGHLGLAVALASGTFTPGEQALLEVTFQVAPVTNATTTAISFGSQPTPEQVSDAQARSLPATYSPGIISIASTMLEGDVSPRPDGDGLVGITDWVQEGRFVAGLDTISNTSEFQRADCAPRGTLGDGAITVADWVQVGRYAVGLDPITIAGGPTGPASGNIVANGHRQNSLSTPITIVPLSQGGSTSSVAVQLVAQGTETALSFSVAFDPTMVRFVSGSLGSGISGAVWIQNTNQASLGKLGFVVGLTPPNTFGAGSQQIVDLSFASVSYSNNAVLRFSDAPVTRQLVDASANVLSASYQDMALAMAGTAWPALTINQSGDSVVLSWPSAAVGFGLETTPLFGTNWTPVTATPLTNGDNLILTTPVTPATGFFRLRQQ